MKCSAEILFLVGGVMGVLIVRSCFLNPIEIMGWHIFWSGLQKGEMLFSAEMVIQSATFGKCVVGFLSGGFSLPALARLMQRSAD